MIIVQWVGNDDSRTTTIPTHGRIIIPTHNNSRITKPTHGEADLSVLLGQLLELHARAARVTKKLERED